MAGTAIFGPPVARFAPGGAHVAVHLVPVFQGSLVAFDVEAREARGRWLPWDLLPYAGNPYETAAALGDEWCDGAVIELALVDVISFAAPGESWELALIFRAELASAPPGDADRKPVLLGEADFATVARFEPVDLQRWLGPETPRLPPESGQERKRGNLLF